MSGVQVKQPIREITVWHQRDNFSAKVQTDAVTWGQFKEQNKKEFDFKNVRGVVKLTKNTLDHVDARLPEGDCLIFLFPMKVKSGMNTKAEYEKTYNSKELRSMCSERGLGTDGNKADHAKRLADADKEEAIKSHEVKETIVKAPLQEENKSTAVAPIPANVGFATVEMATVKTTMKVRINDVSQLNNLLEVMFPGMEVVAVDAMVDLTAELKLGVPQAPVTKPVVDEAKDEAIEAEVVEPPKKETPAPSAKKEKPTKKAPKKVKKAAKADKPESGMSDAEMKAEAEAMKSQFNF